MLYQLSYRLPGYNADRRPGKRLPSQVSIGLRVFCADIMRGIPTRANVAELADALDLGSSARKGMGVRPSPFAPHRSRK
jgi:hypothetical protein